MLLGLEGPQTHSILARFTGEKIEAQREAVGKGCMAGERAIYQAGTQHVQPLHGLRVGHHSQHPIHKKHHLAQC